MPLVMTELVQPSQYLFRTYASISSLGNMKVVQLDVLTHSILKGKGNFFYSV